MKDPARFCAALSGRASRESTRYSSQVRAHRSSLEFKWNRDILAQTQKIGHSELCKRDFRAGPGSGRSLRPFFTRVLRHVLAQIQRIGQSELQKRDFRAGPGHMKSTRLGTNVKDRQNAENRPSELRKRDFRAGAPTARFSSWPRKRPFFARVHMKSSHFSSTQRIGDAPKVRLSQAAVLC